MSANEAKIIGGYSKADYLRNLEQDLIMRNALINAQFITQEKVDHALLINTKINTVLQNEGKKVFLGSVLIDMKFISIPKLMIILIALEIKSKVSGLLRSKNIICSYDINTVLEELKGEFNKGVKGELNNYLVSKIAEVIKFYNSEEVNVLNEQDYSFMSDKEIITICENYVNEKENSFTGLIK